MTSITFTITPAGETRIRTEGYTGPMCKDVTRAFEKLGQVTADVNTADFYKQPKQELTHETKP